MEKVKERELNLDSKVTVKSIASWDVCFDRRHDGQGGVMLAPEGTVRLSRNEVIAQVQGGNTLFTGIDGMGSHATLFIDDAPTRAYLSFESEDGTTKQNVFSDARIKELFGIKSQNSFETQFRDVVRTRAEKAAAIKAIKRLGLNDYAKIRFAEFYTGYNM